MTDQTFELSLLPGKKYAVRAIGNTESGQSITSQVYILNTSIDESAPPDVVGLTAIFSGTGAVASWDGSAAKAVPDFRHFEVTVTSSSYPSTSKIFYTNSESFTLDINTNRSIFSAAAGVITFLVKSVDRTGNLSVGVSATATNSPPADPTNVIASSASLGYNVSWSPVQDSDYDYTRIYESSSLSGTYQVVGTVYGSSIFIPSTEFSPRYIKVSHVDFYGQESNLVQSTPSNVTPQNPIGTDVDPPSSPSGLSFETPRLVTDAGITTSSVLSYWTSTDINTSGYKLRISRNQVNWQVYDIPATRGVVTNRSLLSNVATLTFSTHSFSVGDYVTVFDVDPVFNGVFKITAVTPTTISYNKTNSDVTSTSSSGIVLISSYDITNLITGTLYYASILAYDSENNLTQFVSPNNVTTAGTTPSIGTAISVDGPGGTMKFGPSVNGLGNDGLFINSSNYWYDTGLFNLGVSGNSVSWDGVRLRIDGDLRARSGVFSGNVFITDGSVFAANSIAITSATWSSNVATFTTSSNHSYSVGDRVVVSQTSSGFDGNYTIATVPSSNTFTAPLVPSIGSSIPSVSTGRVANVSRGARTIFDNSGIISYDSNDAIKFVLSNSGSNSIAGWSITTSAISSGSINLNSSTSQITAGNAGFNGAATPNGADGTPIRIWAGSVSPAASPSFYVTNNGYLVATNANISGTISASSGSFTGTVNASGGTFSGFLQAGSTPNIKIGASVSGSNNGIQFSSGDFWYTSGAFRFGGSNGITFSGSGNVSIGTSVNFNANITRGSDYWNSDGSFQFGGSTGIIKGATGAITLGSNVTVNGNISGATGTFTGSLSIGSNFQVNSSGFMTAYAALFRAQNADADTYAIKVMNGGNIEFQRSVAGADNKMLWLGTNGARRVGIEYDASDANGLLLKANYDGNTGRPITLTNRSNHKRGLEVEPDTGVDVVASNFYRRSGASAEAISRFRSNVGSTGAIVSEIRANGSYANLSDINVKDNIIAARDYLYDLLNVEIVTFNYKNSEEKQLGVIAQQLQEIFPSMVTPMGDGGLLGVKYEVFVPMLITAVQELHNRVQYLEEQLEVLNGN